MPSDYQKAVKRADMWFSKYIRLKYSQNGKCKCYTSNNYRDVLEMDCGHFIGRSNLSTRWHEDNARPQSTYANRYRSGQHAEFRQNLIKEIGEERVEALENLPKNIKMSAYEVREISDYYRNKFNELKKEKGNPWG